eukprot:COSAG06_NODE_4661_length_4057_cov_25.593987_3_plen_88_part_00
MVRSSVGIGRRKVGCAAIWWTMGSYRWLVQSRPSYRSAPTESTDRARGSVGVSHCRLGYLAIRYGKDRMAAGAEPSSVDDPALTESR